MAKEVKKLLQLIDRANFGRYSSNRHLSQVASRLTCLVQTGDARVLYWLGMLYWDGRGIAQDQAAGLQLLQAATEAGSSKAAFNLGVAHDTGQGVTKSYHTAFYYHGKAARLGCTESMHCVGSFYYWGQGVAQDYRRARWWYRESAKRGYADGMCDLGRCYQRGVGGSKSLRWATYWFEKAVAAGCTRAQTWLGLAYATEPSEWEKARYWLELAAEHKQPHAMYALGIWAAEDWDGPCNQADAVYWFRQAARLGHQRAALRLAASQGEAF